MPQIKFVWNRIYWVFRLYGVWFWTRFVGVARRRETPDVEFDDRCRLKKKEQGNGDETGERGC
jgi:hypothetical protein